LTEIKRLEKRVDSVSSKLGNERRPMLDEAYMGWLTIHMTSGEQLELCRIIKKRESMNANSVDWKDPAWEHMDADRTQLLHRSGEIHKAAEERAKQELPGAEAHFRERWSRAETLRTLGRRLSEAEGDKLRELNAWLQITSAKTIKRFENANLPIEEQVALKRKELEATPGAFDTGPNLETLSKSSARQRRKKE